MCRTAIGALPIEEKAAKGSGGHKINEYGRRLIADYGWTGGFALVWVCILKHLWLLLLLPTALADEKKI